MPEYSKINTAFGIWLISRNLGRGHTLIGYMYPVPPVLDRVTGGALTFVSAVSLLIEALLLVSCGLAVVATFVASSTTTKLENKVDTQ